MIEPLQAWWIERSGREQVLLGVMGFLLIATAGVYGFWKPLRASQRAADARLERAVAVRSGVESRIAMLADGDAHPPVETAPVADIIVQTAGEIGFDIARPNADSQGRVVFDIASARAQALWMLVGRLDRQGVFVESAQIAPKSDSTLSVTLALRKRGG